MSKLPTRLLSLQLAIIGIWALTARESSPAPLLPVSNSTDAASRSHSSVFSRSWSDPTLASTGLGTFERAMARASEDASDRSNERHPQTHSPKANDEKRLVRLPQVDVNRAIVLEARRIISAHHLDPFGTEIPFEADGKRYVAVIERHYHPPGGEAKPWGYHPGVSVFLPTRVLQ